MDTLEEAPAPPTGAHPRSAPSWRARALARIEAFLSWPLADRILFLFGFMQLAAVCGLGVFPALNYFPGTGAKPDPEVLRQGFWACAAFTLANFAIFAVGFYERRRPEVTKAFVTLVAAATSVQLHYFIYLAGFQSTAVLSLAGTAAVVRLVLNRPLGLLSLALAIGGLAVLTALTGAGLIKYAPLLFDERGNSYVQTPFLGWTSTLLVSAQLAVQFAVVDFVTTRMWRAIGDLRKTNEKLLETQAALVRAESLAAVGSLVSGAAHELRNPLSFSSGLFQSLRDEIQAAPLEEKIKSELLETASRALEGQGRAGAIVERLYRLTDDLEPHGSEALVGDFVEALRESYPGAEITADPKAQGVRLRHAVFRTLLPNLLENALASGGKAPPRLAVSVEDAGEGPQVVLKVSDTGRGIPEAQRKDLFRPFATGQKSGAGHGVGLGLYIVHELANRMGGSVTLETREGQGTTVTVKLPAA